MVAKKMMRAMVHMSLLATWMGTAVWADVITLTNGEVFPDLRVLRFDGQTRQFDVQSNKKSVAIASSEVADIRFDPHPVTLSLTDGSVYNSLEVQQYNGNRGRFSIHRGAKVVEIKADEVASIDFNPIMGPGASGSIQAATAVAEQPGRLPPVLRPIHVVAPPAVNTAISEASLAVKQSAPSLPPPPAVATTEPLPPPPARMPAEVTSSEGVSASEEGEEAPEGWDDDALYGPLGENFGQPKTILPGQTEADYTARWKGSGAASGESLKKSSGKSEGSSAKKKTSSTSKAKPSASRGGGSKKKGGGVSDKEMSEEDQRDSDRSSRRSSRSSRDSGSRSSRDSSRYGSDSRYGGSNYGGSGYGSSRYGGYGSSSGSNYGSRYGGYGSSSGSNYGSRYGGGGYGSSYY